MKKSYATAIAVLLAVMLLVSSFGGCSLPKTAADGSRELVTMSASSISENTLNTRLNIFKLFHGPAVYEADNKGNILNQLIEEQIILDASGEDPIEVEEEQLEFELAMFNQRLENEFGGKEALDAELEESNLSQDDIREFINRQLIRQAVFTMKTEDVELDDDYVQEYYEQNKALFVEPEKVKARHILVETKELAEQLLSQLKDGADFGTLAKEHSTCTGSKDSGGDLGTFGRHDMVDEFGSVAFSLEEGELSDVVETEFGYHIIYLDEKYAERELEFDEVKDRLVPPLLETRRQEVFEEYVKELIDKANIKRHRL